MRIIFPRTLLIKEAIGQREKGWLLKAVFIVNLQTKDLFFLFLRSKKDAIGQNITIKNPLFKKTLLAYLTILREDLRNKNFDSFNL